MRQLRPDPVVANAEENRPEDVAPLREAGPSLSEAPDVLVEQLGG